jgi:hypothetical protein
VIESFVQINTDVVGYHAYCSAPANVSFLASRHRHVFKIRARFQVFVDDRELEFFTELRELNDLLATIFNVDSTLCGIDFGDKSCEQIAHDLLGHYIESERYFKRKIEIEVSEDGENSAIVTRIP